MQVSVDVNTPGWTEIDFISSIDPACRLWVNVVNDDIYELTFVVDIANSALAQIVSLEVQNLAIVSSKYVNSNNINNAELQETDYSNNPVHKLMPDMFGDCPTDVVDRMLAFETELRDFLRTATDSDPVIQRHITALKSIFQI